MCVHAQVRKAATDGCTGGPRTGQHGRNKRSDRRTATATQRTDEGNACTTNRETAQPQHAETKQRTKNLKTNKTNQGLQQRARPSKTRADVQPNKTKERHGATQHRRAGKTGRAERKAQAHRQQHGRTPQPSTDATKAASPPHGKRPRVRPDAARHQTTPAAHQHRQNVGKKNPRPIKASNGQHTNLPAEMVFQFYRPVPHAKKHRTQTGAKTTGTHKNANNDEMN